MTGGKQLGTWRFAVDEYFAQRVHILLILLEFGQLFHYYLVLSYWIRSERPVGG